MEENELGLHSIEKIFNKKVEKTRAKIFDGSLRSGNKLEYEGTLVITGDVNAGAEVVAGESVIIVGNLRGLAHAGAKGNRGAIIVAGSIKAPQLRIADVVKEIDMYEEDNDDTIKRKAYIENEEIIIE